MNKPSLNYNEPGRDVLSNYIRPHIAGNINELEGHTLQPTPLPVCRNDWTGILLGTSLAVMTFTTALLLLVVVYDTIQEIKGRKKNG